MLLSGAGADMQQLTMASAAFHWNRLDSKVLNGSGLVTPRNSGSCSGWHLQGMEQGSRVHAVIRSHIFCRPQGADWFFFVSEVLSIVRRQLPPLNGVARLAAIRVARLLWEGRTGEANMSSPPPTAAPIAPTRGNSGRKVGGSPALSPQPRIPAPAAGHPSILTCLAHRPAPFRLSLRADTVWSNHL
jgi:hypothetical protein